MGDGRLREVFARGGSIYTQSAAALACSKRSDSGERCGVEKAMKSRGGLGREVREPSLTSPPPSLLLFRAPFYFAPLRTI